MQTRLVRCIEKNEYVLLKTVTPSISKFVQLTKPRLFLASLALLAGCLALLWWRGRLCSVVVGLIFLRIGDEVNH